MHPNKKHLSKAISIKKFKLLKKLLTRTHNLFLLRFFGKHGKMILNQNIWHIIRSIKLKNSFSDKIY